MNYWDMFHNFNILKCVVFYSIISFKMWFWGYGSVDLKKKIENFVEIMLKLKSVVRGICFK